MGCLRDLPLVGPDYAKLPDAELLRAADPEGLQLPLAKLLLAENAPACSEGQRGMRMNPPARCTDN